MPQVAVVNFNPVSGTYTIGIEAFGLSGETPTAGAQIAWTDDGSDPVPVTHGNQTPANLFRTIYNVDLNQTRTITIKAIGYKAGYTNSALVTSVYVVTHGPPSPPPRPLGPPSLTPPNGHDLIFPITVDITLGTSGQFIIYTENDGDPSLINGVQAPDGNVTVTLTADTVLRAICARHDQTLVSSMVVGNYTGAPAPLTPPVLTPPGGVNINFPFPVNMTAADPTAIVIYTLNDSTMPPSWTHGTRGGNSVDILLGSNTTVRAIAAIDAEHVSDVATGMYSGVGQQPPPPFFGGDGGITVIVESQDTIFGGVLVQPFSGTPMFGQISPVPIPEPTPPTPPGPLAPTGGDITQLVMGQSYIDIVFNIVQPDNTWQLLSASVVNTDDSTPLNIWPGILTVKTATGFRMQISGVPDTNNYYLHWTFTGTGGGHAPASLPVATSYTLIGPSSGPISSPATFTVAIPVGTTLPAPVTITPSDGGGGVFAPTTCTLSTGSPSTTFSYTPSSYGAKTISTTNSSTLTDPSNLTYTSVASTYTLTGPSSGAVSVPSTNFTVALPAGGVLLSAVTITPNDSSGGGAFTPTTVSLSTGSPSATFTYTPGTSGAKTIGTTNSGTLTNPSPLTYTVGAAGLNDGDPISTWLDSSGNGKNATQTGSARPIFHKSPTTSFPLVRFSVAGSSGLNLASVISGADPWTIFAVMKQATGADTIGSIEGNAAPGLPLGPTLQATNSYVANRGGYGQISTPSNVFHVFTAATTGGTMTVYIDGSPVGGSPIASVNSGDFAYIGYYGGGTPSYSNGDIAEIIFYNNGILGGSRANLEKYLGTKYGITVSGGTAINPDDPAVVANLKGWWKADSL